VEPELSAVVVPVPEAEPLVAGLRSELDVHAAAGVPAHVTVLFPFVPPTDIDDALVTALREVVGRIPAISLTFSRVAWFDDRVVWLAPEPAAPFVALTHAVQERFGLLPYGGEHGTEVVPHLTVAHDAPPARLREAARELEAGLPVHAEIGAAALMVGSRAPDSWRTVADLPLARRSQSGAGGPAHAG
jgi:2'-5' RNA ligase